MNLVTADTETFFSEDYTLSKMTTEEYIRDPRFKLHCVAVKDQGKTWCEDAHVNTPMVLAGEESRKYISQNALLCHNALFDGLIFAHHYNLRPAMWLDTLAMARLLMPHVKSHSLESLAAHFGLPAKIVPYNALRGVRDVTGALYDQTAAGCMHDVELTHAIALKLLPHVPQDELRIIDMTIRMFTEPTLRLDRPLMEWYVQALAYKKQTLLDQLGVTAKDLGSNERFAEILRSVGVEPEMKEGKNEAIFAFAKTDDAFRRLLEHDSDTVALLAEARMETKSTGTATRAQRMLTMDERGPLCVYLNYCGAHTTRWSGGDSMNWQNFKRIDFGPDGKPLQGLDQRGTVRLSILAPAGYRICVADSSQIECRLLNYFAGQWDILEKFKNKVDIYSELASMFYGRQITKTDKAERGTGKQLELSCGYGSGADTIVATAKLGIYGPPVLLTPEQGKAARDLYRQTHPAVKQYWKNATTVLQQLTAGNADFDWGCMKVKGKQIYFPGGTYLDYSNLGFDGEDFYTIGRRGKARMYGAKLVENVIQKAARDFIVEKMLVIGARYKIVLCTHDEIVFLAPEQEADGAVAWALDEFKKAPAWCQGIPLDAEGGHDVRYSK